MVNYNKPPFWVNDVKFFSWFDRFILCNYHSRVKLQFTSSTIHVFQLSILNFFFYNLSLLNDGKLQQTPFLGKQRKFLHGLTVLPSIIYHYRIKLQFTPLNYLSFSAWYSKLFLVTTCPPQGLNYNLIHQLFKFYNLVP